MPPALESAIVHWFCCVLTDDNIYQISSAPQFSAQQEDLKTNKLKLNKYQKRQL